MTSPIDRSVPGTRPSSPAAVAAVEVHTDAPRGRRQRISWGAVFAGALIAVVAQLTLTLLGIGVGFTSLDAVSEVGGVAQGMGIWWIVSGFIALFVGGWVAGRLAGIPARFEGSLHGVLAWGLATLASVWMLTSAVGWLASGALGVAQAGVGAAANVAAAAGPAVMDAVNPDIAWSDIEREVRGLLRDTGVPALQPDSLMNRADTLAGASSAAARRAATNPGQADDILTTLAQRLRRSGSEVASQVDREAAVNLLVERTDLTRPEAERAVDRWSTQLNQAGRDIQRTANAAVDRAGAIAESTVDTVGEAALWAFFALIIGAVAAGAGGAIGRPDTALAGETSYDRDRVS